VDADDLRWCVELAGRRVSLPDGDFVIGRGDDCDLPLADGTVSRHHAVLSSAGDRVTLRDQGSSNGTFVNGRRVRGEVELAAGDRLRLGRVRLSLQRGAAEAATGGRRFCPSCGAWVGAEDARCPRCGEDFSRDRPLSRSEAVAMSEVMAVGEALATPARSTRRASPLAWEEPEGASSADAGDETAVSPRPVDAAPAAGTFGLDGTSLASAAGEAVSYEPAPYREAPYQPAAYEPAVRPLFLPAAGFLRRLAALLLDAAWIGALGLLAASAAGGVERTAGAVTGAATAVAAWWLVCLVGWSRWGTTPGKRLLHLYVCDLDGSPGVSPGRALQRLAASLLTVATLGLGYLRAGLAADHRALHDHLAATYVAYQPARQPPPPAAAPRR